LITKPFYRGKNTASISGFGLGLAIVSNCLNTIMGRMDIQSEIKVGTTVKVFFPKLSSENIKYDIL
jgi:signal transduction histidine kinase